MTISSASIDDDEVSGEDETFGVIEGEKEVGRRVLEGNPPYWDTSVPVSTPLMRLAVNTV